MHLSLWNSWFLYDYSVLIHRYYRFDTLCSCIWTHLIIYTTFHGFKIVFLTQQTWRMDTFMEWIFSFVGCINGGTGVFIQIGSSCYQVVSESVPRQTASERCTAGGGALGTVSSEATLTALGNEVKVQSESGVTTSTVFWLAMNRTRGRILTDNGRVYMAWYIVFVKVSFGRKHVKWLLFSLKLSGGG